MMVMNRPPQPNSGNPCGLVCGRQLWQRGVGPSVAGRAYTLAASVGPLLLGWGHNLLK